MGEGGRKCGGGGGGGGGGSGGGGRKGYMYRHIQPSNSSRQNYLNGYLPYLAAFIFAMHEQLLYKKGISLLGKGFLNWGS